MPLKNKFVLLLISVVILGFSLRLFHLGTPSLSYDEATDAYIVNGSFNRVLNHSALLPYSPTFPYSLYRIFMDLWTKVFGISEFSLRFPSAVFSTLSIIYIFILTKRLFNEKVGIISAFLLTISPYSINYAQESRAYAMFWLFGILSFLFFYEVTRKNRPADLFLYIIFTAGSLYILYPGFIFIVIQNILFFLFFDRAKLKKWLLAQLSIALLYLPQIPETYYSATQLARISWIPKIGNYYSFLLGVFNATAGNLIGRYSKAEFWLYLLLFASSFVYFKDRNYKRPLPAISRNVILVFTWAAAPVIICCLFNILLYPALSADTIRYIGFIHIPLIILFSKGISAYNIRIRSAMLLLLTVLVFSNHLFPYYGNNLKIWGEDWRGVFAKLCKKAGDNDLVLTHRLLWPVKKYYYACNKGEALSYLTTEEGLIGGISDLRITEEGIINSEKDISGKDYDSIFIVYRFDEPRISGRFEGYRLKEQTRAGHIGFAQFKR